MSGINRDKSRQNYTQEYFTCTEFVEEVLDRVESAKEDIFTNPNNKILDNACGDGQFLTEIVIRKIERSGCSLEHALLTTYGVDIMPDNIELCKKRLAGPSPTQEILDILEKNIVCADALTYHYRFDNTPPDMDETKKIAAQFFDW
jgi:2-polyprenyl-3-methyl-5-hydroxy-6-metoxy-1,4-benzoquinol methylase